MTDDFYGEAGVKTITAIGAQEQLMRFIKIIFPLLTLIVLSCSSGSASRQYLVATHCTVTSDDEASLLIAEIPLLAQEGINTLIIEINYAYEWKTHEELLYPNPVTSQTAHAIARQCRNNNMRIIPLVNCVGHQSWEAHTDILLEKYPQFDETPGMYPGNEGIYCRSWCSSNENVYPIVFDLIDEIADAFETKEIHVGLDEIFFIGEDSCPLCRGKDKSELLANAIIKLYNHIVVEKKMTMYMWGDRLIDGNNPDTNYGNEYETSMNDTSRAIDIIPKDIMICDWHYDLCKNYGSIPYFLNKGFMVLPTSYSNVEATNAIVDYSLRFKENGNMLGHIYTNWGDIPNDQLHLWPPMLQTIARFR
jgi:hypothetical protein